MHLGHAAALVQRAQVLVATYAAYPARFKGRLPMPPELPTIVGINLPKAHAVETPHDLNKNAALLTNLKTECLIFIDTFREPQGMFARSLARETRIVGTVVCRGIREQADFWPRARPN